MRTFVIGDIHGAYKALKQCLQQAQFDYDHDRLISLGDICDGFPDVPETVEELLKIKHYEQVLGNHDQWAIAWAERGEKSWLWLYPNAGRITVAAYGGRMPPHHLAFLKAARPWIKRDDRVFVHGGFDPNIPIEQQKSNTCIWDMNLLFSAMRAAKKGSPISPYKEIFVGHFPTHLLGHGHKPMNKCNVWNLDTGCVMGGRLTIMDVETKQYWQSDPTPVLYKRQ